MIEVQTLTDYDIKVLRVLNNEAGFSINQGSDTDKAIRKLKSLGYATGKTFSYVTEEGKEYLSDL